MGAFNYNCLSGIDLGYIKYGSTIKTNFWNKIMLIVRYFRPILITV